MYGDIYKFVEKQKKRFRTNNPFEIADMLGIEIRYKPFKDLKGMYLINERCSFIYLSESLDEYMEKAVLFHELGHHFLHKHLVGQPFHEFALYDMTTKPEMEANIYAANHMISDTEILSLINECYTSEQSARSLCVPHEMLLIKLKDMNTRGYEFNLSYIPKANFLGR